MKQGKKALSLLAVVAFLVMALVPMTALAAATGTAPTSVDITGYGGAAIADGATVYAIPSFVLPQITAALDASAENGDAGSGNTTFGIQWYEDSVADINKLGNVFTLSDAATTPAVLPGSGDTLTGSAQKYIAQAVSATDDTAPWAAVATVDADFTIAAAEKAADQTKDAAWGNGVAGAISYAWTNAPTAALVDGKLVYRWAFDSASSSVKTDPANLPAAGQTGNSLDLSAVQYKTAGTYVYTCTPELNGDSAGSDYVQKVTVTIGDTPAVTNLVTPVDATVADGIAANAIVATLTPAELPAGYVVRCALGTAPTGAWTDANSTQLTFGGGTYKNNAAIELPEGTTAPSTLNFTVAIVDAQGNLITGSDAPTYSGRINITAAATPTTITLVEDNGQSSFEVDQTAALTATVSGTTDATQMRWSVSTGTEGTEWSLSPNPSTITNGAAKTSFQGKAAGTYTVYAYIDTDDDGNYDEGEPKSNELPLQFVTAGTANFSVTPATASSSAAVEVEQGKTITLTGTALNLSGYTITWAKQGYAQAGATFVPASGLTIAQDGSSATTSVTDATTYPVTLQISDNAQTGLFQVNATASKTGEADIPVTVYIRIVESSGETPGPSTLTVTPAAPSIAVGGRVQLTATQDGTNPSVTWASSDDNVATVSNTGLVIGVAAGTATITATTADGATGTATVTVTSNGGTTEPTDEPTATATAAPGATPSASVPASNAPTVPAPAASNPAVLPPVTTTTTAPSASPSASPSGSASAAPSGSAAPTPAATAPVQINESAGDVPEDLEVTANPSGAGSVITGAPISTPQETNSVSELKGWIAVPEGGSIQVLTASGAPAADDAPMATGMIVRVYDADGQAIQESTLVVMADVMGTGEISLTQLVNMAAAYMGTKPLEGVYALAANLDGSGSITLTDLVIAARIFREAGLTMNR